MGVFWSTVQGIQAALGKAGWRAVSLGKGGVVDEKGRVEGGVIGGGRTLKYDLLTSSKLMKQRAWLKRSSALRLSSCPKSFTSTS